MTLHLSKFSGVVLAGSPDARATTELSLADGFDLGLRGQLAAASMPSDYAALRDESDTGAWDHLYALGHAVFAQESKVIAVGNHLLQYQLAFLEREGSPTPVPVAQVFAIGAPHGLANPGVIVTMAQMPVFPGGAERIFVNLGAREGYYPNLAPGLFLFIDSGGGLIAPIDDFSALASAVPLAVQLYFRGIALHANHLWGWGYDSLDATNFDGPCRIMFSAPGDGMSWGLDNQGAAVPRLYTDSDAIILGDAGEIIRGALSWNGRLYVGTNRKLHFVGGVGRDTFLTDGSNPVSESYGVVGQHAIIEGPDRNLYGVCEKSGLWVMGTNGAPDPVGLKLVDYNGRSPGYWDCIWTDPSQLTDYPGKTNRDLVWMVSDVDHDQVIIGIPFCNATTGYGFGADTVVVKYHTRSGAFTRQVYAGVCYTGADWVRAENMQREGRFMGTATIGELHVQRYAYQATQITSPAMPVPLPIVEFGPYAVFGPDGVGALTRLYLTLSWQALTSLPIAFAVSVVGDEEEIDSFALTIGPTAPVAPAAGDVWLDTSETDTNIGNATAGATVEARGGYLAKRYIRSAWRSMFVGGGSGARATVPMPVERTRAARMLYRFACTAASDRFQIEGLGQAPGAGRHDV